MSDRNGMIAYLEKALREEEMELLRIVESHPELRAALEDCFEESQEGFTKILEFLRPWVGKPGLGFLLSEIPSAPCSTGVRCKDVLGWLGEYKETLAKLFLTGEAQEEVHA